MNTEQNNLFITVIWAYVQSYNNAKSVFVKKKLKEGLKDTLKKWSDQPVKMVSKKVIERCDKENPPIDPFSLLWPDRNKLGFVKGKRNIQKSWLVWEHTTPLNEFFNTLINCNNENEIKDAMISYSGVCWISRIEDDCLNGKKYRNNRPGGWRKCYNECGIEIITASNKI